MFVGFIILGVLLSLAVLCTWLAFRVRRAWAKLIAAFLALVLFAPAGYLLWLACIAHLGWTFHIATVKCGGDRSIEIRGSYWWELAQDLLYQPRIGGTRQLRYDSFVGCTHNSPKTLKFSAIVSHDNDIVAVVEAANPKVVIIVHDFRRNWSWPENWDLPSEENDRQGAELVRLLNAEDPARRLVLPADAKEYIMVGDHHNESEESQLSNNQEAEQSAPPVSGTRGTPPANAGAAPQVPNGEP